jgi:hypothetical protein
MVILPIVSSVIIVGCSLAIVVLSTLVADFVTEMAVDICDLYDKYFTIKID